ncbi:hypothetical protein JCM10599A_65470 [Paraburkholderia kururiensis]
MTAYVLVGVNAGDEMPDIVTPEALVTASVPFVRSKLFAADPPGVIVMVAVLLSVTIAVGLAVTPLA